MNGINKAKGRNLLALAKALECSAESLEHCIGEPGQVSAIHTNVTETMQPPRESKGYPLIIWEAAGAWREACDNFTPGDADIWLNSDANARPHGYWLEVSGPSMQPTFTPGMRMLVKPESFDLTSGKLYIAKLISTGETTFKKYLRAGGQEFLQPINPALPIIPVTDDIHMFGMVIDVKLPSSIF
ncbi:S24 family peptidase [Pseudomonas sp.]|uniref:S24 family peptidase n=1 Tax=Pseudomonas sp. TaxID=306 RepID=UPI00258117AF|nr:S24 family peptidase [Pseudomonas sp.]